MGEMDQKIDRHTRYIKDVTIKNDNGEEDTFTIRALPYNYMGKIWEVMRIMGKDKALADKDLDEDEAVRKVLETLDGEAVNKIMDLVVDTLKLSYPKEDKDKVEALAVSHWMDFFVSVIELNFGGTQQIPKTK